MPRRILRVTKEDIVESRIPVLRAIRTGQERSYVCPVARCFRRYGYERAHVGSSVVSLDPSHWSYLPWWVCVWIALYDMAVITGLSFLTPGRITFTMDLPSLEDIYPGD